MSKAYNDKGQFNDDASKCIEKLEKILGKEYKSLLSKGYALPEIYDIINQANILQRGKHTWDNI